jgi:hypothetical protein
MTSHANLVRGHHEELTTLESFGVFLEYGIELVDLGVQVGSGKPSARPGG